MRCINIALKMFLVYCVEIIKLLHNIGGSGDRQPTVALNYSVQLCLCTFCSTLVSLPSVGLVA